MSHKVTINLTDHECDLVAAACLLDGEGASMHSIGRRVRRIMHNAVELLETDAAIRDSVKIKERYQRRKRVGLEVVEGDG